MSQTCQMLSWRSAGRPYWEHRRHDTEVLFRRMMGRAVVTRYEYNVIMGVFNDAVKKIQGKRGPI